MEYAKQYHDQQLTTPETVNVSSWESCSMAQRLGSGENNMKH